ncbi:MAG: CcdB family protein [Hydrogenophaga sp.]|uniref:CcdB family protein n=1 Tax=Hydrogenophaga sp. TaxID=1904254 RepID=UPI003D9B25C1
MAQDDVYPNPSTSAGQGIPYVVVIQSDLLDGLATRLTIPLATLSYSGQVPSALCPLVNVKGQRLHALAHFAAPLPAKLLRKPVGSVAAQASALVAAVDAVLYGI